MPFEWIRRLTSTLRHTTDAELDEEIRAHLEMATEAYLEQGLSPEEAQRAARRDFGGVDQVKERHREGRRPRWTRGILRDVRTGVRSLLKRPAFSLIAVLTLGLGIGATAAVFSLVQGVLLTPPPYTSPDELALVLPMRTDGTEAEPPDWTAAQWLVWEGEVESFESIGAYRWNFNYLVSDEGSESVQGMWVTPGYFRTLGLEPALGRLFNRNETGGEGAPAAIILGYDYWMNRFGGDPTILGQAVRISRQDPSPIVVGVMPPGIRFLPTPSTAQEPGYDVNALVDYWMPAAPTAQSDPQVLQRRMWTVVGRLSPGVSPDAARAELQTLTERQAETNPVYQGVGPRVEPLGDFMNRDGRRILLPLLAAAVLVLLIACGNAAALLLVRGLQRSREFGVRAAIGAGSADLLRLVTVESGLLAVAGAGLGVALAVGIVQAFRTIGGEAIPRLDAVTTGWPVLLFGLGAALVAALAAGWYPAFQASRRSTAGTLGESGLRTSAGRGERRILAVVTMAQAALTLTLLVGAGLLIRTMGNLAGVDAGYRTSQVMTMSVTAVEGDWSDFHRTALERVLQVPGVEGAAFAWGVPLTGNNWPADVGVEGAVGTGRDGELPSLPMRSVTPGYFALLGQTLIEGRDVRDSDDEEADRVAIVNEAFVERYIPDSPPLGRTLVTPAFGTDPFHIVGVVADSRTDDITRQAQPEIYVSMWQISPFSKHLVVRTAGDPAQVAVAVQQAVRSVDPTVAVEDLRSLDEIRADSVASRRFATRLLVGFALIACILTLGGIYGVLSLSVASRRKEIAIRRTVGADGGMVLGLVLREGARVVGVGLAVGLLASLALARVLGSFLYGVAPTDATTLVVMAALFSAVALFASWFPARRAAAIDPMQALRED